MIDGRNKLDGVLRSSNLLLGSGMALSREWLQFDSSNVVFFKHQGSSMIQANSNCTCKTGGMAFPS